MFQDFMKSDPDIRVTVVRACSILGPRGIGSVSTGMFKSVMIRLIGYDPRFQFLHEEDLAEVITVLIEQGQPGVFNAGGDGSLAYREVIAATGKPCLALPAGPMSFLLSLSWRLRLQSESPPGGLEFIKYPIIMSTEKLRAATGFRFRYSTQQVLESFLEAL